MNRPSFEDFKKQALEQPGVKADYERLASAFELRRKLILYRKRARNPVFVFEPIRSPLKTAFLTISNIPATNDYNINH